MLRLRPGHARGHADHGWLQSHHSFSFANYHDPEHMAWGNLRVINEDRIAPGQGFGTHPHRDMEIVSYVLSGALAHRDSMGNGTSIPPGDVQRLSAGSGLLHSEYNHSATEQTHFLQIWVLPNRLGEPPSYAQKTFTEADKRGRLCLLVSEEGADGAVSWRADARLYAALLDGDEAIEAHLAPGRKGYLFVARGRLMAGGHDLRAGDALLLEQEPALQLSQGQDAELLWFDLAP